MFLVKASLAFIKAETDCTCLLLVLSTVLSLLIVTLLLIKAISFILVKINSLSFLRLFVTIEPNIEFHKDFDYYFDFLVRRLPI